MTLQPFEQSCQGCHHQNSNDHHDDSLKKDVLTVFDLPYIEFDDYDGWPEDAEASELSPILIALLSGLEETQPLMHTLFISEDDDGYEGDLEFWLEEQEEEDKVTFAQGIKEIMVMISQPKNVAIKQVNETLTQALGAYVPNSTIEDVSESLVSSGAALSVFNQLLDDDFDSEIHYDDSYAGWVLNSEAFSLNYRAITHGDPLLAALMQTSAILNARYDDLNSAEIVSFTDNLNDTFKSCSNCHNTQLKAPLNWSSDHLQRESIGFRKFTHDTHVRVGDKLQQCASCHKPSEDKSHDFSGVSNPMCTSCHEPKTGLDQCTTCHNYHNFKFSMMETPEPLW